MRTQIQPSPEKVQRRLVLIVGTEEYVFLKISCLWRTCSATFKAACRLVPASEYVENKEGARPVQPQMRRLVESDPSSLAEMLTNLVVKLTWWNTFTDYQNLSHSQVCTPSGEFYKEATIGPQYIVHTRVHLAHWSQLAATVIAPSTDLSNQQ